MKFSLLDVEVVLKMVGVQKITKTSKRIRCRCPFASYTNVHKNGDANPSFVIFQGDEVDETLYTCTCLEKGKLTSLFYRLSELALSNKDVQAAFRFDDGNAAMKELLGGQHFTPSSTSPKASKKLKKAIVEYPAWWLAKFPPVVIPDMQADPNNPKVQIPVLDADGEPVFKHHILAYEYLLGRGITYDMMIDYDIRVDEKRCMVCFPHYNHEGKLAGMRGRSYLATDEERAVAYEGTSLSPDTKHYCYVTKHEDSYTSNQSTVWFLEDRLVEDTLAWKNCPTIVLESAIDAVLIGCSATAMLGCDPDVDKYAFFKGSAGIVWLGDSKGDGTDEDGVANARIKARDACKKFGIPYWDAFYPSGYKDVGDMAQKDSSALLKFVDDIYQKIYDEYVAGLSQELIAAKEAVKPPPYWHMPTGLDLAKPIIICEQVCDVADLADVPNVICPLINNFVREEFQLLKGAKEILLYSKGGNATHNFRLFAEDFFTKANIPFKLYYDINLFIADIATDAMLQSVE